MSHTPGPWQMTWENTVTIAIASTGPTALTVAHVKRGLVGPHDVEARANTHLIAAAPAMLAACRAADTYHAALARHAVQQKPWVQSEELDSLYEQWESLTKAALAKVKGDSQ